MITPSPSLRPIFDSHLDLSYNALSYDRDQTLEVDDFREREAGMSEWDRGLPVLSLPELRRSNVRVCLATLLARARPDDKLTESPNRVGLNHGSQSIAYGIARGQLGYYELLETRGHIRLIRTQAEFKQLLADWDNDPANTPIGVILSMEGADPIVEPEQAEHWFDLGLRTLSLAHYGQSAYAFGTGGNAPLTDRGRAILPILERLGMILDLTHTSDQSFWEALDRFAGRVFASHNNVRALVPGDRQYSDEQIKAIAQRDGVIGAVFDSWMLTTNYQRLRDKPSPATLDSVAAHIDHICQLLGHTRFAALGTDLDGGYDGKQAPADLDYYRDLHNLAHCLSARGYDDDAIDAIFFGNHARLFGDALPA